MTDRLILRNATMVTGNSSAVGDLGIEGGRISGVWPGGMHRTWPGADEINLRGKILMAGGIDAHVHFREPGMTWKADMASESTAALLGGITSFVDMPNTTPPTVNLSTLEDKLQRASGSSLANYGFHIGATNDNVDQIQRYISLGLGTRFAGIKVFMGSSTGNMLVDRDSALERVFGIQGKPILVHSEDEGIIKENLRKAIEKYGEDIPFSMHPMIRSREACLKSTRKALDLAIKYRTRLHVLHVSTSEEVEMLREAKRINPLITAETSVNYLWFSDEDYARMGGKLKSNPAVKSVDDRNALIRALSDGTIDTIGSDHAPHLSEEKDKPYLSCPSGLPSVQQSLPMAVHIAMSHGIPLTRIASAVSEKPASIFGIESRGFLKKGCYADMVVIDPEGGQVIGTPAYKCGWTPYEGVKPCGRVEMVWINGIMVVNDGVVCPEISQSKTRQLRFHPTVSQ